MTDGPETRTPALWRIIGVVAFGPLLATLDSTSANVALTTLSRELHSPLVHIQWVVSGYLLALALALPLSGWLVDRAGAKRVYLCCFTGFVAASTVCAASTSADMLITARIAQGLAGGLLAPMGQMMLTRRARGRDLARIMGVASVPISLGGIIAPFVAGSILQHGSWRGLFLFINVPVGLTAIVLAAMILPRDEPGQRRRLDLLGLALISPGLAMLLYGATLLGAPHGSHWLGRGMLTASLAFLATFVWRSLIMRDAPLLDLRLFRERTFAGAAGVQFLNAAMSLGGMFLLPIYYLIVKGESAGRTGLLLLPSGVGVLVIMPLVAALMRRYSHPTLLIWSAGATLLGTAPFIFTNLAIPYGWLAVAQFVRGAGIGAISLPALAAAYEGLPAAAISTATTTLNIVQRLGAPVAVSSLALLMQNLSNGRPQPSPSAVGAGFSALCIVAVLVGLASALFRPPRESPPSLARPKPRGDRLSKNTEGHLVDNLS
jgi:EmrB/QacA subfamily drug resistance transporter